MTQPFLGEIRAFAVAFAPTGWAVCNGALLPLSQNTALFSLLGTTYGGDGRSNFGLPNLVGRTPIAPGQGAGLSLRDLGESAGVASVTLLSSQMPQHTHTPQVSTVAPGGAAATADPTGAVWGQARGYTYAPVPGTTPMSAQALAPAGGGLPHNNLPPYQTVTFCIAMQGVFPPRG